MEGAGPLPLPTLPGDHGRRAGERAGRPTRLGRRLHRPGVRRRRDRGHGRHRHRPRRAGGSLPRWAARPAARGLVPGARSRGRGDRDGAALAAAARLRRAQGQLRRLGEGQPALLARRLPRLGRVLHVPGLHRAALDQASGGRCRLGPGDRRRDPAAHDAGDQRPHRGGRRGDLPGSALPGPRGPRRRRRHRALRDRCGAGAVDRRGAGNDPRRRPCPNDARTRPDEPADPRLRRTDLPEGRSASVPGAVPATAGAGRCTSVSPIGLGHVRRDLAIADELRALHPDLQIDWLTQHPVTRVLAERGERVHPASRWLASECAHIEAEAGEHDLARVPGRPADGRDPRRQLHGLRRPRRATSPTTCGSSTRHGTSTTSCTTTPSSSAPRTRGSPTSSAGCRCPKEERPRPRSPRTRTPSASSGCAATRGCATAPCSSATRDDLVDTPLGPDLPTVREWTDGALRLPRLRHRLRAPAADRAGVAGRARLPARRAGLPGRRRRLGGRAPTCCAGPSQAFPPAEEKVPGLRMVAVAGPRIDPASISAPDGVEVAATCPICTATSPPATWRWCRAG